MGGYAKSVTIPTRVTYNGKTYSVTSIGVEAFFLCSSLTSIEIPNSVTSIGCMAFSSCSSLTSIEIPNSVTSIGDGAFVSCSSLTNIEIPNSVTSIGNYAFRGCSSLTSIEIPNSVTSIGDEAFSGCSRLTSIDIPNSVTSIGSYAFSGCSRLTSIDIPNSVTSIGVAVFRGCSSLTSIEIPNSVTSIGYLAFSYCSSLTSIEIPNSVTRIEGSAFYGCSNLKIVINNSNLNITKGSSDFGYIAYYADRVLSGDYVDGFIFDGEDGDYILTYYLGNETNLVLPDNYMEQSYRIGNNAFDGCSSLTNIEIPNSVTSIGEGAFQHCSGLTSIEIPNSVTSIGDDAFKDCSNLKIVINNSNLNITKGSTSFGYIAYYADKVLSGENVDGFFFDGEDGDYILTGYWGNETNLVLPDNYMEQSYRIGNSAFLDYSSLTSIEISNSVTSIGNSAFRGCSSLTSIEIPNSVTSIGDYAFSGCSNLTSIEIPNSVTRIGDYAFDGCSGLTSIEIPNSVTSIGDGAFNGCSSIKSMTIGAGVLSIGAYQSTPQKVIWLTNTPPKGWSNLKETINYVANEQYGYANNIKVYGFLSSMFETDGIKYVPTNPADRTCDAIDCNYDSTQTDINIGETVSYKGVTMTVQNIMPYFAYRNNKIQQLSITSKADIGDYAFYGCTGIINATIANDGYIGKSAFENSMIAEGAALNIANKGNIEENAFYGCTGISSLTLGDDITALGKSAFQRCENLTTITIPNKVTTLADYCFADIQGLSTVHLGNAIKSIGNYCFNGCGLTSISIPANVTTIGDFVFKSCASLTEVIIEDRQLHLNLGSNDSSPLFSDCPLDSVYIGGNISYDTSSSKGHSPFYRNTSLRSVVITDKEEEISDNEFYGCTNLKNVTIGDDINTIGRWAFSGCSNLDYFSFGKSVKSIGQEAFSDCVNLKKLISYAEVPPTCDTNALDDINKWVCTLQIPQNTLSAYQSANQWKDFFFIEEVLSEIVGLTINKNYDTNVDVYSINGQLIKRNADAKQLSKELPTGIYIINGKKVYVR